MTSSLIDDALVEMVARRLLLVAEADGRSWDHFLRDLDGYPEKEFSAIARAALAVAVPEIGRKCEQAINRMAERARTGSYSSRDLGVFLDGVDAAKESLRSLTKDTTP